MHYLYLFKSNQFTIHSIKLKNSNQLISKIKINTKSIAKYILLQNRNTQWCIQKLQDDIGDNSLNLVTEKKKISIDNLIN